jgi:hypothetical protein
MGSKDGRFKPELNFYFNLFFYKTPKEQLIKAKIE